jgi:lipopolysaccharide/colanic/teichoic acid biosynthesis glycosyltransferase
MFTATRLEGIPRATPFIHALVLAAGLVGARVIARIYDPDRHARKSLQTAGTTENIIMIGSTRLSSLYIALLEACGPGRHRVIGVLDEQRGMKGRSVSDVPVIGTPAELLTILEEFAVHGITTHRVIIGGDQNFLPDEAMDEIERVCSLREVDVDFVPTLVGLSRPRHPQSEKAQPQDAGKPEPVEIPPADVPTSPYFRIKRLPDVVISSLLVIILLPVFILVGGIVLLDVGSPVLFWQQRLGARGRTFLLHKFRSLKPSYDWRGIPIPSSERASEVGRMLRRSRLDELPQLLNILTGDMSLVGPRPLLPADQPENPTIRLLVRPGITGWAQVNGGNLLTPQEKDDLDEWYVRNASAWLDFRIILMTAQMLLRGERRSETALAQARSVRNQSPSSWHKTDVGSVFYEQDSQRTGSIRTR